MSHFRYVPRTVLWRYPSATGVRLPRARCRRPVAPAGGRERLPAVPDIPGDTAHHTPPGLAWNPLVDELFEQTPIRVDGHRVRMRRQLERLIKTYNVAHAKPL